MTESEKFFCKPFGNRSHCSTRKKQQCEYCKLSQQNKRPTFTIKREDGSEHSTGLDLDAVCEIARKLDIDLEPWRDGLTRTGSAAMPDDLGIMTVTMVVPDRQAPNAYNIVISEYQRLLMIDALRLAERHPRWKKQPGEIEPNAADELALLLQMFTGLRQQEEKSPGVLHGFCL